MHRCACLFLLALLALPGAAQAGPMSKRLAQVKTWMYLIQDLDMNDSVQALADSPYELLVIEPGHNFSDGPYETERIVRRLRTAPDGARRILLAYVDIGQAEDYRDYWQPGWKAPQPGKPGTPDFLVTPDPDGWSGNFTVAYWRPTWKKIWLGKDGIITQLARMGFDGVYLDWIEAYDDEHVIKAASAEQRDPAKEMLTFIEEIGEAGTAVNENFMIVAQNAPYLIDADPERYEEAIDALAVEDTWFHGEADADWDDPHAGDLHLIHDQNQDDYSTEDRLAQYLKYQERGIPVFSVDYCVSEENAAMVYEQAVEAGLIPLVTRVSLSRMTETPPFDYIPANN
ncbi:endo alpha-1,4 polygalactosaminidase [Salidesulfovibrio onnuriiensis]|uniref:endo alpha-1,4 polygalactosaminidase n=1 Tax=Salidesulfovibrio onnuriiensis TaxID=2583823 RepID=UPI00164F07CD|nr:endo alpha-1,4 polygalactosaminidase [Salidesulfovibrio onnuriiensis]